MPEMGESVTEGIVLEWHVAEGDFVNEGDTVVEVSTDKVDAEVPAPADGVITKLIASVDDEVPVGAPLAEMEPGERRRRRSGIGRGSCRERRRPRLRAKPASGDGPLLRRHPRAAPRVQPDGTNGTAIGRPGDSRGSAGRCRRMASTLAR